MKTPTVACAVFTMAVSGTTTPRIGSRMPACRLPIWRAASDIGTQYQKPVIYDECKYEGNIPQGWGNLDAKTMTQRFWLGTMGGCYVGHGETYQHPQDILWWSKGGVLHGESPQRIQWLKDFMAQAPPFDELQPLGDRSGAIPAGQARRVLPALLPGFAAAGPSSWPAIGPTKWT